jgi:iron(II)-dependent oxidoreductase
VPYSAQLNPPLWETGHVAWFQDYWIARSRQRELGIACDPDHERLAGRLPKPMRFTTPAASPTSRAGRLPLPALARRATTLARAWTRRWRLLADADETDDALYFYRLSLFHEDMHAEAAIYMAQALDIALPAGLMRALGPAAETRPAHRAQPWIARLRRRRLCLRQRTAGP